MSSGPSRRGIHVICQFPHDGSRTDVTRLTSNAVIDYIAFMPRPETPTTTLTIRNVDPAVKGRLRMRAASHGRSMEAELRSILIDALKPDPEPAPNLDEAIRRRFAPLGGVDLEEHPSVTIQPPPTFGQ